MENQHIYSGGKGWCMCMHTHVCTSGYTHTHTCKHTSAHVCGRQSIVSDIVTQMLSSLP